MTTALVAMWTDDAAVAARVSDGKGPEAARFRRAYGKDRVKLVDVEEARKLLGRYCELKREGKAP